jgi:hypothetical protein
MQRLAGHQSKPVRSLEVPLLHIEPVACGPASGLRLHRTVFAVEAGADTDRRRRP